MKIAPIILASASPRRSAILRAAGVKFSVIPSGIQEKIRRPNPRALVRDLALLKARDVALHHPGKIVLGADTLVVCGGKILGKPKSRAHARRMLALQAGRWQFVYTGVAVVLGKRVWRGVAASRVKTRILSDAELDHLAGKHMDKAGAYAVQDKRDPFVSKIVGDRDNVVGLPMRLVRRLLARARRAK